MGVGSLGRFIRVSHSKLCDGTPPYCNLVFPSLVFPFVVCVPLEVVSLLCDVMLYVLCLSLVSPLVLCFFLLDYFCCGTLLLSPSIGGGP